MGNCVKITDIHPNPKNPRLIKGDKFKKLVTSIQEDSWLLEGEPIIIDETNMILAGNMRYKALLELKYTDIPDNWIKKYDNLTEKQKQKVIMKTNILYGEDDWDMIANEWDLDEIEAWGKDIPLDRREVEVEEDEAPEVSSEPAISKLGEIYQLGRHRVMCGDSTDAGNVALLMDGVKADMVFTDPPYGMNLDTDYSTLKSGEGKSKKHDKVIGDDIAYDPKPLFDMFGYCKEIILFGADYYMPRIPDWDKGNWLIWDKRETENYDKVIGSSFEVLWSKVKRRKEILRYEFVSWGKRMEDGEKTHPTMKPVKLLGRILDMTDCDTIVDLFLGSGSTLIACERTNRICYGCELDEKYVDVIRKRYWKFTHDNNEEGWEDGTKAIGV